MTKEQEELKIDIAIENESRKLVSELTDKHGKLSPVYIQGLKDGIYTALTTESIYSKAWLVKEQEWISVDTPPNRLEKVWLLFKDNSVGEGVFYEGHFGDISAPYFAFYYQPIKWMKQVPPAPPLNK